MRDTARLWYRAMRPFSFTASVAPVLVGSVLAFDEAIHPGRFLLALFGAVAIHAGTNLVNDYFDHRKGADGPHSLGPAGMIQRGLLSPRAVLTGGVIGFAAGSAAGLVLVALTGPAILWLGLASVAAGVLYTAGPAALAYIGLGELTVFIFMGPVIVLGSYYVQLERFGWGPAVVSLPVAFLVAAILHANNLRDIEDDRRTGKRTVATLIGRRWATYEYLALIAAAYISLLAGVLAGIIAWPVLVALATAPAALQAARLAAATVEPRALNALVRGTARLHLRFGILMATGLIIGLAM